MAITSAWNARLTPSMASVGLCRIMQHRRERAIDNRDLVTLRSSSSDEYGVMASAFNVGREMLSIDCLQVKRADRHTTIERSAPDAPSRAVR